MLAYQTPSLLPRIPVPHTRPHAILHGRVFISALPEAPCARTTAQSLPESDAEPATPCATCSQSLVCARSSRGARARTLVTRRARHREVSAASDADDDASGVLKSEGARTADNATGHACLMAERGV